MADYECCANCGKETDVPVDYVDIGVGGLRYPQTVFCSGKCEQEWLARTDDVGEGDPFKCRFNLG